uniref:Uncharacterized protein n=2 Tax=Physcomitrium patens TaxID=3218 RepID=A0A7I4DNM7_PHYPA
MRGGGLFVCFISLRYIGLITVCIRLGACLSGERTHLFRRRGRGCFMVLSLELTEAVIPAHLHVEVWDSSVVWLEIASRAFIVKCFRSMPGRSVNSTDKTCCLHVKLPWYPNPHQRIYPAIFMAQFHKELDTTSGGGKSLKGEVRASFRDRATTLQCRERNA